VAVAQHLVTTARGRFRPLEAGGRPAIEAWQQLHHFLAQALSPAHARLLSEPRIDAAAGTIGWYAPAGRSRPLDAAGRRRRAVLIADIRRLADDLDGAGDEARRGLGCMLRLTLEVPDAAPALQVDDQPVLVAWAHAATEAPARTGQGLLMALAIMLVLLVGGLAAVSLWRHLPRPVVTSRIEPRELAAIAALTAEHNRAAALRQRLNDLRLQFAVVPASTPRPSTSTLPSDVKPSMPAAPKPPVEVAPLAPPVRR
jgi:hypothetical protein